MKRIILALALLPAPTVVFAQCNGVFPNNTICGNISGSSNIPRPVPNSALIGVPGGTNGQIQYNNSGAFGGFTPGGDLTFSNPNFTISSGVVSNSKLATVPQHTFKGNNTGSTAAPLDLTDTQATAELNAMVGDSGSGGTKGLAPAPAAGDAAANKFLKASGAWATLPSTTTLVDITAAPYSAACNGSTDDSTAIQTWLTALPTAGTGYIPAGKTCLFNGIITVPSGAYWFMYNATLKAKTNANSNTCICFSQSDQLSTGPSNAGVFGGTIDGNTANRATPGQAANIYIIAATNITIRDVTSKNSSGTADCFGIGGDTTHGLSAQVVFDHVYGTNCHRNGLAAFGVTILSILDSRFNGAVTTPGNGIDIEPDATTNPTNYVTILNTTTDSNAGCGITVNPGGVSGAAVVSGQAMNITAFSNSGAADFCQYTTTADKAGFRFINAHGTFGGTTPAVDALP